MTDKREKKKISVLLLLGGDMEQSPIQAFLHIDISSTAIYLERKLSLTTPAKLKSRAQCEGWSQFSWKKTIFKLHMQQKCPIEFVG